MKIHVYLHRPDEEDGWRTFVLTDRDIGDNATKNWNGASVSSALQYLQQEIDPSLGYMLSCRRGLCNLCVMRIDGLVTTACTTPLHDGIRVEPARASLLLRDTIVELSLVRRARLKGPGSE